MKNLVLVAALTILQCQSASALVILLENCKTNNGALQVVVTDNQGTGPVRSHLFMASVLNSEQKEIVSYEVYPPPLVESASFGRHPYTDKITQGRRFSLSFPSTNYPHISLMVQLPDGRKVRTDNLTCSHL